MRSPELLVNRFLTTILLFGVALSAIGCERGVIELPDIFSETETRASAAFELDSLAADGAVVSVSGMVLEQNDTEVIIDDGTGFVRVDLSESPPLLTGQWLLASGTLVERDGLPLLQASEWLYDSTAVRVHSD